MDCKRVKVTTFPNFSPQQVHTWEKPVTPSLPPPATPHGQSHTHVAQTEPMAYTGRTLSPQREPHFSGLKHHTFVPLQFWRSEMGVTALKLRCQLGCLLPGGSRGDSLPFLVCRGHLHSLACGLFFSHQSQERPGFLILTLTPHRLLPRLKDPCDGPIGITQDNVPI